MESSSLFFDFDALDEQEEEQAGVDGLLDGKETDCCKGSPSPEEAAGSTDDGDSEDNLSEVWPGEIQGESSLALSEAFETWQEEDAVTLWEVVSTRVVVRTQPSLDALVSAICSQGELVAEQRDDSNPDWVKMATGLGFILKDGQKKDPSLGVLIQPFQLGNVPAACRREVSPLLRDAWVEARGSNPLLKPHLVRGLRKAADDSVVLANSTRTGCFSVEVFANAFLSEVRKLLAAQNEVAQPGPPATPAAVAAPVGSGGPAVTYRDHMLGGSRRVTLKRVKELMSSMKQHVLPCVGDVETILNEATVLCGFQASLVKLTVPSDSTLHVVGDIHGQYWDLLHVIEEFGEPSSSNLYLFNGDFVDRGRYSVEVAIALLALKVAEPGYVHLNRGNHESIRMNAIYGFMAEVKQKYTENIFTRFCQAFRSLPLATVVNDSVFVVHGGLGSADNIRLEDIAQLNRKKEPDEHADELMLELLWSDPMESPGFRKSPRGGGVLFGPDVTQRFCSDNGLVCVVRSHEMKQDGFEWHHEKMCLTIFSAPNYCGICGNLGAVCDIKPRTDGCRIALSDMQVRSFEATDHL